MDYPEEDARQAVAKGAALIRSRWPGALATVDLNVLDMRSLSDCVLGQASGGRPFDEAAIALFSDASLLTATTTREERLDADQVRELCTLTVEHGFDLSESVRRDDLVRERAWALLTRAWRQAIAAEQASGEPG